MSQPFLKIAGLCLSSALLLSSCFRAQPTLNPQNGGPGSPLLNALEAQPVFGNTDSNIRKIKAKPYNGKISFVLLGDNRNSTPFSSGGNKIYQKVIDTVNEINPDFAINLGDFTFDALRPHWKTFESITSASRVPYLTVVGNHDILFGRSYYESRYTAPNPETGLDDYSFDYGDSRFIIMDSANYSFTDRQFDWMEKQMQTPLKKLVFSHTPPSYGVWKHKLAPSPEVSRRWMELNKKYQVNHVFLGHIHLYDKQNFEGVDYIVSGGAGSPLSHSAGFGQQIYHVVLVEIENGQVRTKMIPIDTKIKTYGPTVFDDGILPAEMNSPRVLQKYPEDFIPPEEQ